MNKEIDNRKLKVPAAMIAYVHNTTEGAVWVAKSKPTPVTKDYLKTEKEIISAVERIKKRRQEKIQNSQR